jgi:hypothetical protein
MVHNEKMPLRNSYHSSRDPASGKLTYKGNAIKHTKGQPYLVDCSVTGSDVGSATKPCFPLLNLWKYTLVPAIAQLLAPGAPCFGAQVIVQQDNAGPHVEEVYSAWMLAMFEELGWMYEPQAPQGMSKIYIDNLLCMITSMSLQARTPMFWICTFSHRCPTVTVRSYSVSPTLNYLLMLFGSVLKAYGLTLFPLKWPGHVYQRH